MINKYNFEIIKNKEKQPNEEQKQRTWTRQPPQKIPFLIHTSISFRLLNGTRIRFYNSKKGYVAGARL